MQKCILHLPAHRRYPTCPRIIPCTPVCLYHNRGTCRSSKQGAGFLYSPKVLRRLCLQSELHVCRARGENDSGSAPQLRTGPNDAHLRNADSSYRVWRGSRPHQMLWFLTHPPPPPPLRCISSCVCRLFRYRHALSRNCILLLLRILAVTDSLHDSVLTLRPIPSQPSVLRVSKSSLVPRYNNKASMR